MKCNELEDGTPLKCSCAGRVCGVRFKRYNAFHVLTNNALANAGLKVIMINKIHFAFCLCLCYCTVGLLLFGWQRKTFKMVHYSSFRQIAARKSGQQKCLHTYTYTHTSRMQIVLRYGYEEYEFSVCGGTSFGLHLMLLKF